MELPVLTAYRLQGISMGRLEAIWLKRSRGGPMDSVHEVVAVGGRGLKGGADFDQKRHVSLIEKEVFEGLEEELDAEVDPAKRRANFLVEGIQLRDTPGRTLIIGDLRIRIRGETKPCRIMDEAQEGLRTALESQWRGGVHGSVLNDAVVRIGDKVHWERQR